MYLIYEIFIWIFFTVSSPFFIYKFFTTEKYRAGLKERLGLYNWKKIQKTEKKRIWIHAVSVGETMAASFLASQLHKKIPDCEIFFSTTTVTGQKTAQNRVKWAHKIFYFPLDFSFAVKRAIKQVNPDICILIETEIWPNFLRICKKERIPIIIANGRLSEKSFKGYKRLGPIIKRILQDITLFSMQTNADAERIKRLGAAEDRIRVVGNIKFDQALASSKTVKKEEIRKKFNIPTDKFILLFASTHSGEEKILIPLFKKLKEEKENLFLIIAPRHPERFDEVASIIEKEGMSYLRRTNIENSNSNAAKGYDILLLDSVGELYMLFSVCDLVFMGGSLVPVGGHNLLEAAVFGKPTVFGPHMHNFRDIASIIISNKAGYQVSNEKELIQIMKHFIDNPTELSEASNNCKLIFDENSGATDKNVEIIKGLIL